MRLFPYLLLLIVAVDTRSEPLVPPGEDRVAGAFKEAYKQFESNPDTNILEVMKKTVNKPLLDQSRASRQKDSLNKNEAVKKKLESKSATYKTPQQIFIKNSGPKMEKEITQEELPINSDSFDKEIIFEKPSPNKKH